MRLGHRTGDSDLLGRSIEVAAALGALAGPAPLVAVQGPPGIGKSALVADLAVRVAGGWRLARGAARELELDQPFAILSEALDGLVELPPPGQGASVESWLARFDAMAAAAPTLLVLEDLHWADLGSLAVLVRLVREHGQLPVGLLATVRTTSRRPEVDTLLAALTETTSALVVDLGPLRPEEVTELARAVVGLPGPALRHELDRAGGSPLLVRELLAGMRAAGSLGRTPDGATELVGDGWGGTVASSVLHRLGFLAATTRALLTQCAVLGSRFPVPELVALTGRSTSNLWPEMEELERSGLLRVEGDQLCFSHDLVRQAVYDDLAAPVRVSAHADAARRLDAAGASVVVVSEHVLRSVRDDDDTAVDSLQQAASRVLDRAPGLALTLLDAALERMNPLDGHRRALACDRAGALLAAGRHQEAMSACRALLDVGGGDPVASRLGEILTHASLAVGELDDALVDSAARSGEVSEGRLAVLRGYRTIGTALTAESVERPVERAEAWGRVGACFFRDVDRVGELGREALELARQGHDVAAEANALGVVCLSLRSRLELEEFRAASSRAVALADASGVRLAYALFPHGNASYAAYDRDQHDEAAAHLAAGERVAQALGDDNYLQLMLVVGAAQQLARGDWDGALAALQAGIALAESIGARAWVEPAVIRGRVALHRRGPAYAAPHLDEARTLVEAGMPAREIGGTTRLEIACLERSGPIEPAAELAVRLWSDLDTIGDRVGQTELAPDAVRLAKAVGRSDVAEAAARAAEDSAARNPGVPSVASWALRARGLADDDPEPLLLGLRQARRSLRRPDIARAATDAALLLAAARRTPEARSCAHEALETWGALEAEAETAWVRAQLRAVGLAVGVRGQRARPKSGRESLTATELKVARLAAEARSNPEIAELLVVSRRTIQTHIGNVLAKLGIASRRDLVLAVAEGRLEQLGGKSE